MPNRRQVDCTDFITTLSCPKDREKLLDSLIAVYVTFRAVFSDTSSEEGDLTARK